MPAVLTACALLDDNEELAEEELADEAAPGCDLVGGRLDAGEDDEDETDDAAAGAAGAEETADELDCALDWELLMLLKILELELELLADVLAVDEAQESTIDRISERPSRIITAFSPVNLYIRG